MSLTSKQVPVLHSDAEALKVAHELAAVLKRDSALRDRERRLPHDELELFSHTGLWGISVPKAYGGAGVSNTTLAQVIALISAADSSLGQIPQNHFYALEVLRVNGRPQQKQRLYAQVLAGERFGNALAELGTKNAHERTTHLAKAEHGFRITGRKFYATGALYAQRIPTLVVDDDGVQHLAFVPRDSEGLSIIDDWSGFGQRTTGSGSVVLDNVFVAAEALLERAGEFLDIAQGDPNASTVAAASIAVAEARAISTEISLAAGSTLFELAGSQATLAEHGLDRHWRNARVHTLHDPVRWKYHAIGNYYLNDENPPLRGTI